MKTLFVIAALLIAGGIGLIPAHFGEPWLGALLALVVFYHLLKAHDRLT